MHRSPGLRGTVLALLLGFAAPLRGGEEAPGEASAEGLRGYSPTILPASDEPVLAMRRFRAPAGFEVDLVAAEPHLANPVAFCTDEKGRIFVAETFRLDKGVTDNRGHMVWLDDDLASRTVEDRVAMYRKHLGDGFRSYGIEHDRVRLLEDLDGDGRVDRASVFADGFNDPADGIGSGILARGGDVWYACLPHLWLLRDADGDGRAEFRRSLQRGYGVHVAFIGHDLHGLTFGPDGKLYFSIGDRGLNVETEGRRVAVIDTGSVLRSNPDGSELEVFATGLRNPQELAFDRFGNLFTGENNCDHGDGARWVHIVEGGDSGWRIGYQYLPVPQNPWFAERLWVPQFDGQPAYIVPPIANLADGPSGLTVDPGTAFPERYRHRFFLCDFRGDSARSGILALEIEPRGASFALKSEERFLWGVLATDCDFAPDGSLLLTDWVEGWSALGRGRVYRVRSPEMQKDPRTLEVKRLISEGLISKGMPRRAPQELRKLLGHADRRVRQEAQFALAALGTGAVHLLAAEALQEENLLGRLHALWGLGQVARRDAKAIALVVGLMDDPEPEVRAQAARVAGDLRAKDATDRLIGLLADPSPRPRFFAAIALGRIGAAGARTAEALDPLLKLLAENADRDPFLRHAAVLGLAGLKDAGKLLARAGDAPPAVRRGVLLALRRLEAVEIARFLADPDPSLVIEAARAIYDVPIPAAMAQLAATEPATESATEPATGASEALLRRIINACRRIGGAGEAEKVAAIAARASAPLSVRLECLEILGEWSRPAGRDRLMALWRPLPPRPEGLAKAALAPRWATLLVDPSPEVGLAAQDLCASLGAREAVPILRRIVMDAAGLPGKRAGIRTGALRAIDRLGAEDLPQIVERVLASGPAAADDQPFRIEALRIQARIDPARAVERIESFLETTRADDRQGAFSILGSIEGGKADGLLSLWMDRLIEGKVPLEGQHDLLDAAGRRSTAEVRQKIARFEASRPVEPPAARHRELTSGGNAERGRKLFYERAELSCVRCHRIRGDDERVGPDLAGIGSRQSREYLLESLIDPNRQIAQGFETVTLVLKTGEIVSGVLREEDGEAIRLINPEGRVSTFSKERIRSRDRGPSAMPEEIIKPLGRGDLRDLVEFLASLRQDS